MEPSPYHPQVKIYNSPKMSFLGCSVYLASNAPHTEMLRKNIAEPPMTSCWAGIAKVGNSLNSDTIASIIKRLTKINTLAITVQTVLFFEMIKSNRTVISAKANGLTEKGGL